MAPLTAASSTACMACGRVSATHWLLLRQADSGTAGAMRGVQRLSESLRDCGCREARATRHQHCYFLACFAAASCGLHSPCRQPTLCLPLQGAMYVCQALQGHDDEETFSAIQASMLRC